jgi:hypothetical protein
VEKLRNGDVCCNRADEVEARRGSTGRSFRYRAIATHQCAGKGSVLIPFSYFLGTTFMIPRSGGHYRGGCGSEWDVHACGNHACRAYDATVRDLERTRLTGV